MTMMKLHEIRTDGGTMARVGLDKALIKEYAARMREGDKFPPVVVFFDGSEYWLSDGFHRFNAVTLNKKKEIEAEIREGSLEDATLYGFSRVGKNGKRATNKDIRYIVSAMLRHPKWSLWSNNEMAKHIGISAMTISRTRKLLESQGELAERTAVVYKDKHGNESVMKTDAIKDKPKAEPTPIERPTTKPDSSSAQFVDPAIGMLEEQIRELTDTITSLDEENSTLKDKIAIGQWDASEIEKIDIQDTISDLRKQVKVLEEENRVLREGRDMYMNRNSELAKELKAVKNKLKKFVVEA